MPDISGIIKSAIIRSNFSDLVLSMASRPDDAVATVYPSLVSMISMKSRIDCSSSTTKILDAIYLPESL